MAFEQCGEARVWWDSSGNGTPLLLINGLSSPSAVWFRLVPFLSPHHRVITFDNLGTGRTGTPPGPYTMKMHADAAAAVIRAAGETSVHVLGISLGGMMAQELTLNHPELVLSLTLVSTSAGFAHLTGDPEAAAAIASAGALSGEERYRFMVPFAHSPATPPGRIDEDCAVREQHPTSEEGYENQRQGALAWDRLDEMGAIACPTLVLHGDGDRMVSLESAKKLADHIPSARLTVLADCGHSLFTDQPEIGAQTVLDFLSSVEQPV